MPDEEGHVTHFTVPALPWKLTQEQMDDCLMDEVIARHIGNVIREMVERTDRAMMGLPELLEGVTPENVHPEVQTGPAVGYECEDCESDECSRDEED
jgi:hypothetical protein